MIRRYLTALRLGLMAAEWLGAVVVFLVVSRIRFGDGEWLEVWQRFGLDILVVAALFGTAWVASLWYQGAFRLRTRWVFRSEAVDIGRAIGVLIGLTLAGLFIVKEEDVSRLFLISLFTTQACVTLAVRATLRAGFTYLREHGRNTHFMVVVGTGRSARDFADLVEGRAGLGIRVIGHLTVPGQSVRGLRRPVLGGVEELPQVFHAQVVDEVAVCLDGRWMRLCDEIVEMAAKEGKAIRIPSEPPRIRLPNAREEEFEGILVRSLTFDHDHEVGLLLKRVLDVSGAIVALVLLSPLLLGIALVIALREGGPVLFRQCRVGVGGRSFTLLKFRTMVPDAEARLAEVQHLNGHNGIVFKAHDDPRVTKLGRLLRTTSLDELPQLWNVLRGEMSLVGPRPPLVGEVAQYDVWHRRRLSMKPGMTGLWQVEARQDPDFDHWVERDLAYIDRWSFLLDLKILARTARVVFAHNGR